MPRQARIDLPGLLQHVIVRGIEGRDVFCDGHDRATFVRRLQGLLAETETDCLAWALLSNHFHLLLRPRKGKLATFMRRLQTGHAVTFNLRHHRSGHLFQNRYKSIVCEEESYLLELVRYIHLNPLRAGLVPTLEALDHYPWCGHAVLMGYRALGEQCVGEILERFGATTKAARLAYRSYVEAGVPLGWQQHLVGGGLRRSRRSESGEIPEAPQVFDERVLGGAAFVDTLRQEEALQDRLPPVVGVEELVSRVARAYRVPAESIRRRRRLVPLSEARAVACYLAVRELGIAGVEVGRVLGMGRAATSAAVQRGERVVLKRPDLLKLVQAAGPARGEEALNGGNL